MDQKQIATSSAPRIWIRAETKPGEERVPLVPSDVSELLHAGFTVTVEASSIRKIPDDDFKRIGCQMAESNSWYEHAPDDAIILGLKELPEDDKPLKRRHIFFAHCFKDQAGWKDILGRFKRGGGLLWDLEYLKWPETRRRVAAFGRQAGCVGMAVGLLAYAAQLTNTPLSSLTSWESTEDMVMKVTETLESALREVGRPDGWRPSVLIIGALGRCGGGAADIAGKCGLNTITKWDMNETAACQFGPLLDHEILVNCIYLTKKIDPFLTMNDIKDKGSDRMLSVFVDVSCDTSNPNNPYPIYDTGTTLNEPVLRIVPADDNTTPLDVVAIDHLPSLNPAEASAEYSRQLLPHILDLPLDPPSKVWTSAQDLFESKLQEI